MTSTAFRYPPPRRAHPPRTRDPGLGCERQDQQGHRGEPRDQRTYRRAAPRARHAQAWSALGRGTGAADALTLPDRYVRSRIPPRRRRVNTSFPPGRSVRLRIMHGRITAMCTANVACSSEGCLLSPEYPNLDPDGAASRCGIDVTARICTGGSALSPRRAVRQHLHGALGYDQDLHHQRIG